MANTYTQIHIQTVFSVWDRDCIIRPNWKDELFRYITGIISNHRHKLLAINGMPDHVHILFGMRPSQSLSELMQDVKGDSSKWINKNHFVKGSFAWQEGFGAFSYCKKEVTNVIQYITNQEEHHRKKTFITEYQEMLKEFGITYEDRFIFNPVEIDYSISDNIND